MHCSRMSDINNEADFSSEWIDSGALDLFKTNAARHFEGVEVCAVCYSVICVIDRSMPSERCRTCKQVSRRQMHTPQLVSILNVASSQFFHPSCLTNGSRAHMARVARCVDLSFRFVRKAHSGKKVPVTPCSCHILVELTSLYR